jgi:hypothetical protein
LFIAYPGRNIVTIYRAKVQKWQAGDGTAKELPWCTPVSLGHYVSLK